MTIARELLAFDRSPPTLTRLAREVLAFDRISLRRYDADRRLHVEDCNLSKATVNPYYGREIPNAEALGLDPNKVYKLYRDPEELRLAAPTFARMQLMLLHTVVTAEKPELSSTAGCIGSDVRFETPYLKGSLAIWTARAVSLVENKAQCQLSCSYRYRADMTPGVSPEGLDYDGVMRDIVANHVALVEEGRAGPDVLVSDSLPFEFREARHTMKRPKLFALLKPYLKADTDLVALDAKMDAEAEAAGDEDLEDEDDEKKAAKLKAAARDKKARDKAARDSDPVLDPKEKALKDGAEDEADVEAAVDAALKRRGYVTAEAAGKLASDAAASAVKAQSDLHTARETVKPLVGVVALDSATAVYQHALKHIGVSFDGIHESALPAVVAAELRARKAGPATPRVATDAAVAAIGLDSIFTAAK